MNQNNWSVEEDIILLDSLSKGESYTDISNKINKKPGSIKYHIGSLAYNDYKNNVEETNICKKYNLLSHQLKGAINRIERHSTSPTITTINSNGRRIGRRSVTEEQTSTTKVVNKSETKVKYDSKHIITKLTECETKLTTIIHLLQSMNTK